VLVRAQLQADQAAGIVLKVRSFLPSLLPSLLPFLLPVFLLFYPSSAFPFLPFPSPFSPFPFFLFPFPPSLYPDCRTLRGREPESDGGGLHSIGPEREVILIPPYFEEYRQQHNDGLLRGEGSTKEEKSIRESRVSQYKGGKRKDNQ